jgi:AraC-like DNA-binding protein
MVILTENNAFQNIGKCLQKKCKNTEQIEDFLQYCIEFLFYDKTYIVGIVPTDVIKDTRDVIDLLKNEYSLGMIKFEYIKDNSKKAHEFIQNVSKTLYKHIDIFFDNHKEMTENEALSFLPNLSEKTIKLVKNATRAIKDKNINILSGEYAELSKFSTDSSHYRILNNDNRIYDKIFNFVNEKGWNDTMTLNLLSEIRLLSNRELARMNDQVFSPSIKRGRIDYFNRLKRGQIDTIQERIDSTIKKTGNLLGAVKMPSIKEYIIEKGHGDPKEILKITCELRNKFSNIRKYIRNYGKSGEINSISVLNEIANELFRKIENGPPYKSKIVFENIHTYATGVGSYTATVPIKDRKTINRINELGVCVEVFTEVTQNIKNQSYYGCEKELIKNCFE